MSKFLVEGRDAGRLLNWISANNVDGDAGQITYTQWLDEAGKLQADLTVTKLDDERYLGRRVGHRAPPRLTWMKRQFGDAHAFVADVTSGYAQINIQGPRSRELHAARDDRTCPTRRFRSAPRARSTSASRACSASASRTSASSATSCTSRPSKRSHVYDRLVAVGENVGLATPASRRSRAAAWRRAIATTVTTSTTPTRCSKPASASPSI